MMDTYVYSLKDALYINLTNRCTNRCDFCIRTTAAGVGGYDLWMKREPSPADIMEQLEGFDVAASSEIVFCGYGEPMMRLDALLETAAQIKCKYPGKRIRINTNGQANLIYGGDITPRLEGLVDAISISLNAPSAKEYDQVCHSVYGGLAFEGMLDFARLAKKYVPEVILSIVDVIGEEDIKKCRSIASSIGVSLRVREKQ